MLAGTHTCSLYPDNLMESAALMIGYEKSAIPDLEPLTLYWDVLF